MLRGPIMVWIHDETWDSRGLKSFIMCCNSHGTYTVNVVTTNSLTEHTSRKPWNPKLFFEIWIKRISGIDSLSNFNLGDTVSLKKSIGNTSKNHNSTKSTYLTKHSLARCIITSRDYQPCSLPERERDSDWWHHYALSNGFCEALTEHTHESVMMRELVHGCHSDFQLWDSWAKKLLLMEHTGCETFAWRSHQPLTTRVFPWE